MELRLPSYQPCGTNHCPYGDYERPCWGVVRKRGLLKIDGIPFDVWTCDGHANQGKSYERSAHTEDRVFLARSVDNGKSVPTIDAGTGGGNGGLKGDGGSAR